MDELICPSGCVCPPLSLYPREPDIFGAGWQVPKVQYQKSGTSFDHLALTHEQR
jgi:hypothetical protein